MQKEKGRKKQNALVVHKLHCQVEKIQICPKYIHWDLSVEEISREVYLRMEYLTGICIVIIHI